MGFENYKDKQKFYKERAKQEKMFFISKPPKVLDKGEKGRTYIKSEEDKNNDKKRDISKN